MRFLRRRRGAYAWIGIAVMLTQLFSSAALAVGHSTHGGSNAVSPPSADTPSHEHCAAGADPAAVVQDAGQDGAAPDHCPHCADRACCLLGCAPVILEFSAFPPSRDAVVDTYSLASLSPACCAESLYRPPINL